MSPLSPGLVVLSREGCHLCEDMLLALAELERDGSIPEVKVVDVDSEAELARQFGLKVPVLLLDGSVVCHYTLNSKELLRLVGRSPAIIPR
ncbi:MAG TPA: glutaredoxin family protein [Steroidobacteraceae bacterium]|jgi:predicted thioredoxin/glutaredoxin|nr:glutaredoxin family protein [Steroidobacteraceae bacterium]